MFTISETPAGLTVYTPIWIGLLALAAALALGAYVGLRAKAKAKLNVKIAAAGTAVPILLWIGWSVLSTSATLQRVGVIVDGPFGEEIRAPWSLVRSYETDERASLHGKATFFVLQIEGGDEVAIPLSGLSAEETVKVIDFVKARTRR